MSVVTRAEHAAGIVARRPELMVVAADRDEQVQRVLAGAAAVVVGPGLGRSAWGRNLLQRTLMAARPSVVDADALWWLADGLDLNLPRDCVLTPHSAEAARLLDTDVNTVERDRLAAVCRLRLQPDTVALLKGPGTLIAGQDADDQLRISLCEHGNPGMGTAGMGDVLAGIIGGLRAQGLSSLQAARVGACLHGASADRAAASGWRGLIASDVLRQLAPVMNDPTQDEQ